MRSRKFLAVAVLGAAVLSGCASDDPHRRANTGAAVGAIVGGVVGHQLDSNAGSVLGAATGAIAGAAVGDYMDRQEQQMKQALASDRRRNELQVQRLQDQSLKVSLNNEVSFDFDSASLKPTFYPTLNKVADVLRRFGRTTIHIVGYTDNVGSAGYNRDLSRRRALAVADYLHGQGVTASRISIQGRGEADPRASNKTAAGRQLNRRVEIFVRPASESATGAYREIDSPAAPNRREGAPAQPPTYPERY